MKSVLVIDDDRVIRLLLKQFLQNDYEIHCLDNGNGAEEIITQINPVVVFLDSVMPDREGVETLMGIKNAFPEQLVVGMSGNADYTEIATDLGAEFALVKPLSKDAVMSIMQQAEKLAKK